MKAFEPSPVSMAMCKPFVLYLQLIKINSTIYIQMKLFETVSIVSEQWICSYKRHKASGYSTFFSIESQTHKKCQKFTTLWRRP